MNSRAYVAGFNFKGSDQQKKVGALSGGERNRVHLAKLLRRGGNVLLLDEPTNDLDVDTLRALEEALLAFPGCAVIISHDRWFLDRVATHVLAFEGDSQVTLVRGQLRGLRGVAPRAARRRGRPPAPDHVQEAHARVSAVAIRYFTDPGCPFAFRPSASGCGCCGCTATSSRGSCAWSGWPSARRVAPPTASERCRCVRDADRLARAAGNAATIHACRAVVAARLRWPDRQAALLRRLRVLATAGELLDDSDTLEIAAEQAGLPVAELAAYCAEPEVEAALRADMAAARPSPATSSGGSRARRADRPPRSARRSRSTR